MNAKTKGILPQTKWIMYLAVWGTALGLGATASASTVSIKYAANHLTAAFDLDASEAPPHQEFQFGIVRGGTLKIAAICNTAIPTGTRIFVDSAEPKQDAQDAAPFFEKAKGTSDTHARVLTADVQIYPTEVSLTRVWMLTLSTPTPLKGCTLALDHGGIVTGFRGKNMLHLGQRHQTPSDPDTAQTPTSTAWLGRRELL